MRHPDWPERLHAFVESRRRVPFAWGSNDCCLFAADAVQALTGADPAADFRGRYTTARGALRVMKGRDLAELAAAALGEEVLPVQAQRGDVVLFEGPDLTLGVCLGATVVAPGEAGLVQVPMSKAIRAWRV